VFFDDTYNVRLLVVFDNQSNGAAAGPSIEEVLYSYSWLYPSIGGYMVFESGKNLNNDDRFDIVYDEIITLPPLAKTKMLIEQTAHTDQQIHINSTSEGTFSVVGETIEFDTTCNVDPINVIDSATHNTVYSGMPVEPYDFSIDLRNYHTVYSGSDGEVDTIRTGGLWFYALGLLANEETQENRAWDLWGTFRLYFTDD